MSNISISSSDSGSNRRRTNFKALRGSNKRKKKFYSRDNSIRENFCNLTLVPSLFISIGLVVIGSIYYSDCPILRNTIPIYLIVTGLLGTIYIILSLVVRRTFLFNNILAFIMIGLFLIGTGILVSFDVTMDTTSVKFCHPTLYITFIIYMCIEYLMTILILLYLCVGHLS
ncbi:uncharacterized protein LOC109596642 [Aethina tumida]|uniref:uncharacterized protein LOC109596642 n=1 Tax=Aethina tumida TaxID=116153 RepID=UPI0021476DA4|nr:uncharacterized protein LOC109596642 [Aethina tumida]